ncbi:MAG: hypothetical protein ACRCUS_03855, partial [Anaerovoracaceae bacterium]
VFLIATIRKMITEKDNKKIKGFNIPFTDKNSKFALLYEAKLGIKGNVTIINKGEKNYEITIPKYDVIAAQVKEYERYDTDNGALSILTKDIDEGKSMKEALSISAQEKYIEQNKKLLNESAEEYFTALFQAVDKDIVLKFNFPD